jgi:hypothetical protein
MGFYSGRHGSLQYLGKPVAKVADWRLTVDQDLLSTTKIDAYTESYVPGRRTATGTARLLYYRLGWRDQRVYTQFTALLQNVVRSGMPSSSDRVELTLAVGSKAADQLKLNAYLTSVSMGSTTGEVVSVDIGFTMDGDLLQGVGQ